MIIFWRISRPWYLDKSFLNLVAFDLQTASKINYMNWNMLSQIYESIPVICLYIYICIYIFRRYIEDIWPITISWTSLTLTTCFLQSNMLHSEISVFAYIRCANNIYLWIYASYFVRYMHISCSNLLGIFSIFDFCIIYVVDQFKTIFIRYKQLWPST